MATDTLTTTGPTKPGIYIGKIYRTEAGPAPGFRRYPMLVGKGSRLRSRFNIPVQRSYLTRYALTFSGVSPHVASLTHAASPDQTVARLYKSNNTNVPKTRWSFTETSIGSGVYDQILIVADAFTGKVV